MSGNRIEYYRQDVQNCIAKYRIDKNGNGTIESDNGELSELLSRTKVNDEKDLYSTGRLRNGYIWGMAGTMLTGLLGINLGKHLTSKEVFYKSVNQYKSQLSEMYKIIEDYNHCKINKPAEEVAETLRKLYKKPFLMRAHSKLTTATKIVGLAAALGTLALGIKAAFTSESQDKLGCEE